MLEMLWSGFDKAADIGRKLSSWNSIRSNEMRRELEWFTPVYKGWLHKSELLELGNVDLCDLSPS